MKIYTSYFAKLRSLPENIVPISICGKAPDWYAGLQYKKLAPKYGFFIEWKKTHDNDYYIEHFNSEVLDQLNAKTILEELSKISKKPVTKSGINHRLKKLVDISEEI